MSKINPSLYPDWQTKQQDEIKITREDMELLQNNTYPAVNDNQDQLTALQQGTTQAGDSTLFDGAVKSTDKTDPDTDLYVPTKKVVSELITDAQLGGILPGTINGNLLIDNTVDNSKLINDTVDTNKIKDLAITNDKIQNSTITESKMSNDSITNDKLGTDVKVGSLASLSTTDKTTIVNAINENFTEKEALKDVSSEFLNAKENGAVGDGLTDDTVALQTLLTLAKTNGQVSIYIPNGTYLLTDTLTIYDSTIIEMEEQTILKRNASYNPMLSNGELGASYQLYNGESNITIRGGILDGQGSSIISSFNNLSFGHAENITLDNITFLDNYNFHSIEFNAIRDSRIINCIFDGQTADVSRQFTEMLQLDYMGKSAQFGRFGDYDDTPCQNIVIDSCTFRNGVRGIGSHSYKSSVYHDFIKVNNCHIEGLTSLDNEDWAVQLGRWRNSVVSNNTFEDTNGVILKGATRCILSNNVISNYREKGVFIDDVVESDPPNATLLSTLNTIDSNKIIVTGTTFNGSDGIGVNNSDSNIIVNNDINRTNDNGIQLIGSSFNEIIGNRISKVDEGNITGYGIEVASGSTDTLVSENVVRQSGTTATIGIRNTGTTTNTRLIANKVYDFTTPINDTAGDSVSLYNTDESGAI